jgi:hypothetical protein
MWNLCDGRGGRGLMAREYKREGLCMERLIHEFGAWLKQGFGWLVDVIVFGCLWGISQVSRFFGTAHLGGASILKIVVLVLVLLLLLYAFYWVFGRFIEVIRWALDRIAYALGVILFSAAVVSGFFASAGLVAVVVTWVMSNINLASR